LRCTEIEKRDDDGIVPSIECEKISRKADQ
jgi:hypothetical protein